MLASVLCAALSAGCSGGRSDASPAPDGAVMARDTTSASHDSAGPTAGTRTAPPDRVLFLGTSLTAGLGLEPDSAYPQQIQRRIRAAGLPYEVVNAGVSGETSAGLLRRLDWVLKQPARVIVVETGANDGLRGQSVSGTKATIGQVLDRIRRDRPGAKTALVQMEAPSNLGADYTKSFHAMFPSLAAERGVTLLPFLLDGVAGQPELNQADGIHPNYAGERIVTETVWKALQPLLAP